MPHINPARLFFDLPPSVEDTEDAEAFDSFEIEIFELDSPQSIGTSIDTVRINPHKDYVETDKIVSEFSWFKLVIKNEAGDKKLEANVPILSERTQLRVNQIREAVRDTNRSDPAFSDNELMQKMRLAGMRLNNIRNLSSVGEKFWPIIELLVRIDVCNVLSFDYAKYLRLEIPGGPSLARDELYTHYINVCESLNKYYEDIKKDAVGEISNAGDGVSEGDITVSTMTRLSYETGLIERNLEPSIWFVFISPLKLTNITRFLTQNRTLIL